MKTWERRGKGGEGRKHTIYTTDGRIYELIYAVNMHNHSWSTEQKTENSKKIN